MAKIKTLFICLLWIIIPFYSYSVSSYDYDCIIYNSTEHIDITEKGGNNKGFSDPLFEKQMRAVGWKPSMAWCSFLVKLWLTQCNIPHTITGWSPTSYNKNDVIYTDGEFKQPYFKNDILVMSLSYDKFKNVKSRYKGIGHTGLVKEIGTHSVITIEGNTNDLGTRDSRTGDGVYQKRRPLNKKIHITRWGKRS
jgi:hypothetical protein